MMPQATESTAPVQAVLEDNASSLSQDGDEDSAQLPSNSLQDVMESVVRITLAGLGGSILGLSQEQKLQAMRVVTGAAASAAARRKRVNPNTTTNVPLQWAISCMAFCTLIETSRWLCPTQRITEALFYTSDSETLLRPSPWMSAAWTVSDYSIGGGVGGLAASMGRQTHLRTQLPPSILSGSKRRFFGVVPGLALGFAAGICQAALDGGIAYLERFEYQEAAQGSQKPEQQQQQQQS